ncbi:ABC transporter substrate-binding protein [Amycolatopsis pigmentata]|uniref:ABC transporter substrate-binding protein n=1 Tax=Amycolatopsis pigmentata TaxID=450801 RepID=A0ABW5FMV0_9PSEU
MTRFRSRPLTITALCALAALGAGACAGAGGGGSGSGDTVRILMVNNPQMRALKELAPEFTQQTGIKLSFTELPENDLRDKVNQEFANQSNQYDVSSVSALEVPIFSKRGWMAPLDGYVGKDSAFDQGDVFPAFTKALTSDDGKLYAEPYYGESSFLMYRKDVFAAKNLTMPENPTWDQVAALAAQVGNAEPGMAGICLRGQAGWGQNLAPLSTVVNTFGGTWYDQNWNAQLTSPQFTQATRFYVDLVRKYGEPGAAQAGVQECINTVQQSKAAMFYDATSIAGLLEANDSPVKGKMGYVPAPVKDTANSGWLWTWAWGIEKASPNKDNAWKFISWASGKQFEQQAAAKVGWSKAPTGKRNSTYAQDGYRQAAAPYYQQERTALQKADPANPGVQPRPYSGIQFVGIAEFPSLGTQVSQQISSAIAGQISVPDALAASQKLAQQVGDTHRTG